VLIVAQHPLCRARITGCSDLVAAALQSACTDIAHIRLIIDDEDSRSGAWASE
jgi:hypothetical protein